MEFIDLKRQYQEIKQKVDLAVLECMTGGSFIMGNPVTSLEKRLSEYVGRKHCISCSNGTDALTMSLRALKIGEGDAVFVPAFTFFATAECAALCGATPIFVDIDLDTFNISPSSLRKAIEKTAKTGLFTPKAVIPVDLFGLPCYYDEIYAIAREYGLYVVEDGAQGFGGSFKGRKNCSFGDISATSFFPSKPLGCYGDGGAIFTDNDNLADYLKSIRVHGKGNDKYDNIRIGYNARLDTIQATVLHCKLDVFPNELIQRNRAADLYRKYLSGFVKAPSVPENMISSYAQFTLILEENTDRKQFTEDMKAMGIPTMVYYPRPLHLQTAFESLSYQKGDFPAAEQACKKVVSLPMHPYLTEEEIIQVSDAVKICLAKQK